MSDTEVPSAPPSPDRVAPAEDAGPDTQVRYRFQYQVAAAHCLSLSDAGGVRIVCEWHADFLMETEEGAWEIVSVKHLDEGSWTFATLFDDGGLARLFDTWVGLGRTARARLCTNAGFSSNKSPISARSLEKLCGDFVQLDLVVSDERTSSAVAWAIIKAASKGKYTNTPAAKVPAVEKWLSAEGLPDGMLEAVKEFLAVLRIQSFPPKRFIRDHVIRTYVEPVLKGMKRDTRTAPDCYHNLLGVVYDASSDNDHQPLEPLRHLLEPEAMSLPNKIDERVKRRTITPEAIEACMLAVRAETPSVLPAGRRPPQAPGGRTLEAKLLAAGVGEDDRKYAQRMRNLWHDSWQRLNTGFPQDFELEFELEEDVLHVVRTLRLELNGESHFASRLIAGLHERVRVKKLTDEPSLALHDAHLRGLAYELSDQCLFDFKDLGAS
ncbi:DUF4297 domain-containing protein [Lentzea sp. NEAU-D13]|uniref:DUF4297 domain-containing protein n=1 Tax=Lentzea alba TaxID=2714351 RepID=A0A7C9W3J5_9PSEU|nr:dsDNA nuclease domain-containing protein [Lentzea alba]NGY65338.1 DUF4297 domain-containing protein [Lentzea alba]